MDSLWTPPSYPGAHPGPVPASGVGAILRMSPLAAVLAKNRSAQLRGLGEEEEEAPSYTTRDAVFGLLALAGGFCAGRAMAPSSANKNMWGWGGVAATLVAGPLGLGFQGLYAANKKG